MDQTHASEAEAVEQLKQFMPDIRRCHTVFSQLERQWTWIALTGKINCNAIAATLFDFIFKTRDTFGQLRADMTSMLAEKLLEKAVREMSPVAQVVMDIKGVTPDPAEMNRYFFAGCRCEEKIPDGP